MVEKGLEPNVTITICSYADISYRIKLLSRKRLIREAGLSGFHSRTPVSITISSLSLMTA
jgi:hypothetical protein